MLIFSVEYLYLLMTGFAIIFFLKRPRYQKKEILWLGFVAFTIALLLDKGSNMIIDSPRPFVVENVAPVIPHIADNGFPSEHTLFVMLIAGIIFLYHKKLGIILVIIALWVGVASVISKVHYTIDIVGSILIAVVSILLSQHIRNLRKSSEKTGVII